MVEDLKKYGTVQRAVLDIQGTDVHNYIDAQKAEGKDVDLGTTEGIYVAKVNENGSGEDAGLKEGDVIIEISGKQVKKMPELQEVLASKRPGDKVTITYLRDKKKITKTVTLKNTKGNTEVVKGAADIDVLGGNFRPISDTQKQEFNISYGLEVTKVNSGALKDAGVSKGFIIQKVNDQPIKSIEDLQEVVKEVSGGKESVLWVQGVQPTGKKAYFAVPIE